MPTERSQSSMASGTTTSSCGLSTRRQGQSGLPRTSNGQSERANWLCCFIGRVEAPFRAYVSGQIGTGNLFAVRSASYVLMIDKVAPSTVRLSCTHAESRVCMNCIGASLSFSLCSTRQHQLQAVACVSKKSCSASSIRRRRLQASCALTAICDLSSRFPSKRYMTKLFTSSQSGCFL